MKIAPRSVAISAGLAVSLAACTNPASLGGGSENTNRNTGLGVGGIVGAAVGSALAGSGNRTTGAVVGGVIGATAGGMMGERLDRQAAELNAALNDSIDVQNTGDRLILTLPEDITFDTDSDFVRPSLQSELAKVASSLQQYPDTTIQVIGHTDNQGDAGYNQGLSERRASSVSRVLQSGGVSPNRIVAIGRGEDEPKASNLTPEGMAQNRRVEIMIIPNQG